MAIAPRQAAQPGDDERQRRGLHADEARLRIDPRQARQTTGQTTAQIDETEVRRQPGQALGQAPLGRPTGQIQRHTLEKDVPVQQ